ncbi:hypothetical protein FQN49_005089 [Arthroderma sp. PD_2]|nr:hypothetical protein FQN49_005089 [Arthroderma sp. PD_2]
MGGAIDEPGNVTPFAEFNVFADPVAAARLFALTSSRPRVTMPTISPSSSLQSLPPSRLANPLTVKIAPLDLTHQHNFTPSAFRPTISPLVEAGSPLAQLVSTVVEHTFGMIRHLKLVRAGKEDTVEGQGEEIAVEMSLHDPVCVWYALTAAEGWECKLQDVRVETTGQWTRGMTVVDRRKGRKPVDVEDEEEDESDRGGWLGVGGNRVGVLTGAPAYSLGDNLLSRVFKR